MGFDITVIIPAYNSGLTIEDTIKSVLAQSYPQERIEILVVDDGSTDNTRQVVDKFSNHIKFLKQSNLGVSVARNNAARIAKGKWLAFLDSDDVWDRDKISKQLAGIGNHLWSHTNSYYFGHLQSGRTKRSDYTKQHGGYVFESLILDNFITTSTVIVERELFLEVGGFDESFKALEDWKLWLDLSRIEDLHYCEEPLTHYRITPGSTSRKARVVLPLHLRLIDHVNDKYNLSGLVKNKARSQSYTVCSYIAEDGADFSYSLFCASRALIHDLSFEKTKRFVSCLVRFLRNFR